MAVFVQKVWSLFTIFGARFDVICKKSGHPTEGGGAAEKRPGGGGGNRKGKAPAKRTFFRDLSMIFYLV